MDDKSRIREWAYQLWEKEGRPTGRALDHWLEAERHARTAAPTQQANNEGEGNRTAAREFNREQQAFAQSGPVEKKSPRGGGRARRR